MKKLLSVAAAASLAFTMSACSKDETTNNTPATNVPATSDAPSTSDAPMTSDAPSTSDAPTSSDAPTTSDAPTSANVPPAAGVDQSTPELAMTSWLNAMLSGDAKNTCALMAANGTAIGENAGLTDQCAKGIESMLSSVKGLGDMFKGLKIEGATVNGDNATFEKATTTPAMAAQVINKFKATKINGKWYVTQ